MISVGSKRTSRSGSSGTRAGVDLDGASGGGYGDVNGYSLLEDAQGLLTSVEPHTNSKATITPSRLVSQRARKPESSGYH